MLDSKLIRNDAQAVSEQLKSRGFILDVGQFHALEDKRKTLQMKVQELQSERNAHAKTVGQAKASGKDISSLLKTVNQLGDDLKATEELFNAVQLELNTFLAQIPNIPHASVPIGKSEKDNVIVRTWGEPLSLIHI